MRTTTAALACLLALVAAGCGGAGDGGGGAAGSCAGPQLDDAHDTHRRGRPGPTVAPGDRLALHGEWYTSTCNDTSGADDPLVPLPDVTLTLTYPDGRTSELGPFAPTGDRLGFDATVEVPADMTSGAVTVSDGTGGPPYTFRVGRRAPAG